MKKYYNAVTFDSIEEAIRYNRNYQIGWAIMHMNYWQRLWWALTGQGKYMKRKYWEGTHGTES